MPVFDWNDWFGDHAVHINKTMRPYLKQSILLVNAARSIQDQFRSTGTGSDSDLKVTIKYVSNALKAATDPIVRQKRTADVDEVFETAVREVSNFCARHKINIILNESMGEPAKEDQKATIHLRAVKVIAEKAAKLARSKGSTNLLVTFWSPDLPNGRALAFTVENGIKLDHFLARILQKSLEKKNRLPRVNLIQNPGFFTRIPSTLKDFSEGNRERLARHRHQSELTLCQLDLQDKINDRLRGLHLLLDPPTLPEAELTIFDIEKQKDIKRNYRNIWMLQEHATYAAAREISGCLVRLDPKKPLPPLLVPRPEPPPRLREMPRESVPLPKELIKIHPQALVQEPPKPPVVKAGFFGKLIPQALRWTDPSPPKPEPPPPDPEESETTPDVYLSRNFMSPIKLEMVGVGPSKSKGWFKRRS